MEHRWGQRQQVIVPVRLDGSGENATGWLTDISLSGAYVKTLPGLALWAQVTLEVNEQDGCDLQAGALQLTGRIVRHGIAGIGIEWIEFASETLARILRIASPGHEPTVAAAPNEALEQRLETLAVCSTPIDRYSFLTS